MWKRLHIEQIYASIWYCEIRGCSWAVATINSSMLLRRLSYDLTDSSKHRKSFNVTSLPAFHPRFFQRSMSCTKVRVKFYVSLVYGNYLRTIDHFELNDIFVKPVKIIYRAALHLHQIIFSKYLYSHFEIWIELKTTLHFIINEKFFLNCINIYQVCIKRIYIFEK